METEAPVVHRGQLDHGVDEGRCPQSPRGSVSELSEMEKRLVAGLKQSLNRLADLQVSPLDAMLKRRTIPLLPWRSV